uniref:Cell division cycle protein 27 homolog n=1 Tax=Lygus hesperus TaxID=30085 RepID=A0A0A9YMN2_LYGHE
MQLYMQEMPQSAIALCVAANLYSLNQDNKTALVMLDRALQVNPFCAYAYTLKGYECIALNELTSATEAFSQAMSMDKRMYMAYAGLGEIYLEQDKVDLARRYFQRAL